ncbi:hypothetical protein ZIOFF_031654 [Zingiber officinale]|uniref:Uncharacterized protein n=1 Tax=Zingiber officinale TaxID=94328 RepID=A0A8J5LAZ3_ZINOF|nr:hypothetical protein ZIOFF_031654 [Zingiber officinale]
MSSCRQPPNSRALEVWVHSNAPILLCVRPLHRRTPLRADSPPCVHNRCTSAQCRRRLLHLCATASACHCLHTFFFTVVMPPSALAVIRECLTLLGLVGGFLPPVLLLCPSAPLPVPLSSFQQSGDLRAKCPTCKVCSGIEPHVTLLHFDLPQSLEDEYSGLLSPKIVEDFTAYADVCFRKFGDRVKYWITINEPNIEPILGHDLGIFPPNHCSSSLASSLGLNCSKGNSSVEPYVAGHNLLLSHASTVSLYRKKY